MKVNDADMIYTGAAECDAVYKGNTLVWENNPIVQAVYTITEGKYIAEGSKVMPAYSSFGYKSHPAVASSNDQYWYGGISSTDFLGMRINGVSLAGSGTTRPLASPGLTLSFNGKPPLSTLNRIQRVYFSDYGWVDSSQYVWDQSSTATNPETYLDANPDASRTGIPLADIPSWDGAGQQTLILEYLP